MRSILQRGGLKFCQFDSADSIDFNVSGARVLDGEKKAKIGFGEGRVVYGSREDGFYATPYIFLIDSLRKLYPNYTWQLLNNEREGCPPNSALEQFAIHRDSQWVWPSFDLEKVSKIVWKNPLDLASEEEPPLNLPGEKRYQEGNLLWYDIPQISRGDQTDLVSIKKINAIVIPRKIGFHSDRPCNRPHEFFLEEFIKAQVEFLESNQRISIFDDAGVCIYNLK